MREVEVGRNKEVTRLTAASCNELIFMRCVRHSRMHSSIYNASRTGCDSWWSWWVVLLVTLGVFLISELWRFGRYAQEVLCTIIESITWSQTKCTKNISFLIRYVTMTSFRHIIPLGLCESSFLLLEYSIEYLIAYSSTRLIPEVAINYRVVQNKRTHDFSFKFVVQQRFEMSQCKTDATKRMLKILVQRNCNM